MLIFLSPAKTQRELSVSGETSHPKFFSDAELLNNHLKNCTDAELEKLWKLSPEKFLLQKQLLSEFNKKSFPAIFFYSGLVFKQLKLEEYTKEKIEYLRKNLKILSAYYGVLNAFDGISFYRLDFNNSLKIQGRSLYKFWQKKIKDYLTRQDEKCFCMLCSEEFRKLLPDQISGKIIIDFKFYRVSSGKLKSVSTDSKVMRGKLVNFAIEKQIQKPEDFQKYTYNDYSFSKSLSSENEYVFTQSS